MKRCVYIALHAIGTLELKVGRNFMKLLYKYTCLYKHTTNKYQKFTKVYVILIRFPRNRNDANSLVLQRK
jgi:hypothetical protein